MRSLLCTLLVFFVSTTGVFAQENSDFAIRVFGADDSVAPTIPTLSGSAIAHNQIDISWTVSTDNFFVSGYVLYRDGSPISTTTLTSYSDVSVTASSTYIYSVRAFDTSFNYSSSSNLVSITTPVTPVTPPVVEDGGGTVSAARIVLNELTITPGLSTALFDIKTARPARFEMRWGKTEAYELGYIVNDRFSASYKTTLAELEPGTAYFYEVIGYTPFGAATVLEKGKFETLDRVDFLPPANVVRFNGYADTSDVHLSWQIPVLDNFASVRIVRSHLGFPTHPQDGVIVYQGAAESFTDQDILAQHSPVYYTAFTYDVAGNVSSGAIVRVYRQGEGDGSGIATPVVDTPLGGDGVISQDTGYASTSPQLPSGTKMPDLTQIYVVQANKQQSLAEPKIILNSNQQFVISIPKEVLTVNLKTIIATLTDPTDSRKTYSVLLRLNKEKTAYETVVSPLMVEGASQLTVDIYDYKSAVVGTYRKTVVFSDVRTTLDESSLSLEGVIVKLLPVLLVGLSVTLLGLGLFLLYRRRRKIS